MVKIKGDELIKMFALVRVFALTLIFPLFIFSFPNLAALSFVSLVWATLVGRGSLILGFVLAFSFTIVDAFILPRGLTFTLVHVIFTFCINSDPSGTWRVF